MLDRVTCINPDCVRQVRLKDSKIERLRKIARAALEQIIKNRIEVVGPCSAYAVGVRDCNCSECIARAALAAIDKEKE